jgi:hypothetical protein
MDFDKFFNQEIQKHKVQQREAQAIEEAKRQEKVRSEAEKLQRHQQLVERLHSLLKPILDQFIKTSRLKLSLANYLRDGQFCLYAYKISEIQKLGLFTKAEFNILTIEFGSSHYSEIQVLRIVNSSAGNFLVRNYIEKDLLDDNEIKVRFAKDLMDGCKYNI